MQDYRQPYIDQWLVGLEKQVGGWLKFEALYTRRSNKDMVALVDLNRATNYTKFEGVRVFDGARLPRPLPGRHGLPAGAVGAQLHPGRADPLQGQGRLPGRICRCPASTAADTLHMPWDPKYVVTTAPDAKREFGQFQLSMEISKPLWGMSLSLVAHGPEGQSGQRERLHGSRRLRRRPVRARQRVRERLRRAGQLRRPRVEDVDLGHPPLGRPRRRLLHPPVRRPLLPPVPALPGSASSISRSAPAPWA